MAKQKQSNSTIKTANHNQSPEPGVASDLVNTLIGLAVMILIAAGLVWMMNVLL